MLSGALGRLSRVPLSRISGAAVEAGWLTAHLATYPLGLLRHAAAPRRLERHSLTGLTPDQRGLFHADVAAAGTPILLVHGIADNHATFAVMQRALQRRGFFTVTSFDYGLLTSDVRSAARALAAAVEQLTAETGYDRVHVVGHSLGGLIARYYVQRLDGDRRVHTLVTLGTPHQGTRRASAGRAFPLLRQLHPGSDLLTELSQPAPECRTRFVAFSSDADQLIAPTTSARLEHPDLHATNVVVRGVGHLSLLNNGRIAFQIAQTLRDLDPAQPEPPARTS